MLNQHSVEAPPFSRVVIAPQFLSNIATMDILKNLGIIKARLKNIKIKQGRASGEIEGYIESESRTLFGHFQFNGEVREVRPFESMIICVVCIFVLVISAAIF